MRKLYKFRDQFSLKLINSSMNLDFSQQQELLAEYHSIPFDISKVVDVGSEIKRVTQVLFRAPNLPQSVSAWFNLALLHSKANNFAQAKNVYLAILEKNPGLAPARINLALTYEKLGEIEESIKTLDYEIKQESDRLLILNQKGRLLESAGDLIRAEKSLLMSLMIQPKQESVIQHFTHIRAKQCRWPIIVNLPDLSEVDQIQHMGCLGILAYTDDPYIHFNVVSAWTELRVKKVEKPISANSSMSLTKNKKKRLRIGFMSSDFRWHAVSILMAEFFELIDKSLLEIIAFDFSREDGSGFRRRVLSSFERVVSLHSVDHSLAAKTIQENNIDILVDLNGLTGDARPEIIRYKPAPIIISWLGSLTTTGLEEVDYIISDKYVFLEKYRKCFVEKPLLLETGMHLHDSKRLVGPLQSRKEHGLPEDSFVYCCFNNNYKLTPSVFALWVRILEGAPNSVLWLLADNEWSRKNLLDEFAKNDISADRIIFAKRVAPEQYLARYKLANLFLDTFPYNAGTTAIDCLYVGLPILTCSGRSIASRVAGGVLMHAGIPELIASDWDHYVDMAIDFGISQTNYLSIKEKITSKNLSQSKLFNTTQKAREFEKLMETLHENH